MTRLFPLLLVTTMAHAADDPHLWLEEVEAEKALAWAEDRNAETKEAIASDPGFDLLEARLRAIYDSDDRIAYPSVRGEHWYNFWQDAENPRGVWRRTTAEEYRKHREGGAGAPAWETVLDVDALGAEEGVNWVWKGSTCLYPEYRRCLLSLSRGGADAAVVREFDVETKSFVDGGFALPEAKSRVSWIDADTVFVSTDFGEGSLTESGYPRVVKRWRRGTPLEQAETVFEGNAEDVSVGAYHDATPGWERSIVYRGMTFYTNEAFVVGKGGLERIDKPDSAEVSLWGPWILLELRDPLEVGGTTYPAGSLLADDFARWQKGKKAPKALFTPTDTTSLAGWSTTKNHLLLTTLDDVKDRIDVLTPGKNWKKAWSRRPLAIEGGAMLRKSAWAVDEDVDDRIFLSVSGYTTPSSFLMADLASDASPETLAELPALFDARGLTVTQHFATSKDGTKIPYFQVAKEGVALDGSNPTLLYGYGGFEVSLRPGYSAGVGAAWLEDGGVYVVANIRGGGEYGPRWHQAALKENRHKAYEDFAAVGEDLVSRGLTTRERLGILGGSNGGLLMGNMLTQYPDHWGAIVCKVPLLDMRRYHQLLAGASWMGEYGDPDDPEQWAFIQGFSPYHNLDPEGVDYPPLLVTTSTRDDRVHPGHARKLVAALRAGGEDGVLYYENIEGGHGGAADNAQRAFMDALAYTFLWQTVGGGGE